MELLLFILLLLPACLVATWNLCSLDDLPYLPDVQLQKEEVRLTSLETFC